MSLGAGGPPNGGWGDASSGPDGCGFSCYAPEPRAPLQPREKTLFRFFQNVLYSIPVPFCVVFFSVFSSPRMAAPAAPSSSHLPRCRCTTGWTEVGELWPQSLACQDRGLGEAILTAPA